MRGLGFGARGAAGAKGILRVQDVFAATAFTKGANPQNIVSGMDYTKRHGTAWLKRRDSTGSHNIFSSRRGALKLLQSDTTNGEQTVANSLTSFNSDGVTLGSQYGTTGSYMLWEFMEAENFFAERVVSHTTGTSTVVDLSELGAVGMASIKAVNLSQQWYILHRSLASANHGLGFDTSAQQNFSALTRGATSVTLGAGMPTGTYVIDAWAHNTDADGIIQAFSYTGTGSSSLNSINLNWKPQAVLVKPSSATGSWWWFDDARSPADPRDKGLAPNTSSAETTGSFFDFSFTDTGVTTQSSDSTINGVGVTYVGLAIRAAS